MPYYRRRVQPALEAWQWFPGVKLDGIEERTVTHSHMSNVPRVLGYFKNRYGKEYPITPGDYVYRDGDHWDACPKQLFESQYEPAPAARPTSGNTKLTQEGVRDIKDRLAAGETCTQIGLAVGVSRTTIGDIRAGRTWAHVEVTRGGS